MGYAQVYEWSSLQRAPIAGMVMSILTKYSNKVLTELPDLDNKSDWFQLLDLCKDMGCDREASRKAISLG